MMSAKLTISVANLVNKKNIILTSRKYHKTDSDWNISLDLSVNYMIDI